MDNVKEEKENVNSETSQNDLEKQQVPQKEKKPAKKSTSKASSNKKATTKKAAKDTKKVPSKVEANQDNEDGSAKKEKPPTIDHIFVNRKDTDGRFLINNYRRQGSILFKWTGEYWQEQTEENIKGMISFWLKTNYPAEFYARNLNSIYTMFTNSVLNFSKEKIDGIIIPTRHHWLSIDEKTGDITAIMPDRSQPVKYIIDVIVPAEGKFEIPKEVYCYKKTEQQYVNYKKPPKPFKSKFHKFVGSSLPELQSRARVQEYAGYSLTNSVRKHKAQFWWGNGSDGKSTMIEILSSLHCNPVSVKMSEIGLYNAHLIPASLIYATETPKKGFDEEFFKQAVTGDRVELRAIYGKKQNAHLTGKWILIMNELPHITDFTDGLARRVDIIRWPVQFKGDKVIEDLAYQIIKEEKQIVLYWCLEGLQRMIKNDWKFTESAMVSNAMRDWRNAADKVRLFCVERNYHYDEDKKKKSDKLSLFEAFNKWADYNNFERMSSTGFWMRMNNIFPQLKEDPDMKDKNTGRRACYLYVKAETLT